MTRRTILIMLASLVMISGCIGTPKPPPATDFVRLPLPIETPLVEVQATRTTGGFEFSDAEYEKTVRMIQGLRTERDTLRATIRKYNEWVEKRGR